MTASILAPALSRAVIDRAAHHRLDESWLDEAWSDPATRVLEVAAGQVLVSDAGGEVRLRFCPTSEADDTDRYLLGVADDGTAFFATPVESLAAHDGLKPAGLRAVGAVLPDAEAGLLVHAVALANWHATHTHCPRCGRPTRVAGAGHLRICDHDGTEHYPRTDPAVIMTVAGPDDRLLLGHQASWPSGRFSTLAGFVEPGESLEQTVRREVFEESGLVVSAAAYLGSQPWPFPSSLMLGFAARTEGSDAHADGEELSEVRWFTRAELTAAVDAGEIVLSPRVSIARRLIEHWYGDVIAEPEGATFLSGR